jgi:DNA-binding transcriptional ArsR family regulator
MSVESITWALKQPVKHSSTKFVLVALANCSDAVERLAWPSIAYLCEATSQDRKTVMANLKRLVELGFIEDSGERKGTTKSVVVYRLSDTKIGTPKQYQDRDTFDSEVVPVFPISSPVFPHKQSRFSIEAVPKTGHGTVKNRNRTVKEPNTGDSENLKTKFFLPDWIPSDAWAGFVEMRKHIKKPMTDRALDLKIKDLARFQQKGYDLAAILDKSTANNWSDLYEPKPQDKAYETPYARSQREKYEQMTPAIAAKNPNNPIKRIDPNEFLRTIEAQQNDTRRIAIAG